MDRGKEFSRLIAIELVAEGRRLGIAQKEIAAAVGVGEAQMSLYTKGRRGSMTVAHLIHGCERLGVSPQVIVERAYAALLTADVERHALTQADFDLAANTSDRPTDRQRHDEAHPADGYA